MRLLLDEMISATVAEQLRARGHDVVAVQDPELEHLRGVDDCLLLNHASQERRAVVTDNVADFVRSHQIRVDRDKPHHGLLQLGPLAHEERLITGRDGVSIARLPPPEAV